MHKKEFLEKHHLHFDNVFEEMNFLSALDKLYLEFTPDQVAAIITDFMQNADNIFNDVKEQLEEGIEKLATLFGKDPDSQETDENNLDKKCDA